MKRMQEKDTKGITLIALVITIIVLIILAGVVITLSLGNNGIFNRAKQAKEEYEIAAEKEKYQINEVNNFLEEKPKTLKYDETKLDSKMLLNNVTVSEEGIVDLSQSDSYITINEAFLPGNDTWEVATKFKCASPMVVSDYQFIIGKNGSHDPVCVNINSNKLKVSISTDGINWDVTANQSGTKEIKTDIWYWIKLQFTGSSYQVLVSKDGETYEKDIEVISSKVAAQGNKYILGKNLYGTTQAYQFHGEIDLKETYIKIKNDYFFNGMNYFSYK